MPVSSGRGFQFHWCCRAHFRKIHLFHQPVHSTFADGYAILLRKTEFHFPRAKAFIRIRIEFQNLLPKQLIFLLSVSRLTVTVLVVGAPVYIKDPAKGWRCDADWKESGRHFVSVCVGREACNGFFKMRFSSSSSALRS